MEGVGEGDALVEVTDGVANVKIVSSDQVGVGGTVAQVGGLPSSSSVTENAAIGGLGYGSSENVPEVEDDDAHPCVLNEDILDVVFQLINFSLESGSPAPEVMSKDIQNARLVCKPWRNSATRVYRQTRPVKIFVHPQTSKTWPTNTSTKIPLTLQDFMMTMEASDMIPIQKYKLDASVFANSEPKLIQNFFRICGPDVVSLNISIEPKDAGRIMDKLKTLPPLWQMTKLRMLTFQTFDVPSVGPEGIVDLLEFLFTAGTGLRVFDLSYLPSGQDINLQEQLDQLIATRIPVTVKDLKLGMELNESIFNNIAESGLKLESFELRVPSSLESETLYKLLESQAATLKSLRIWSSRGDQTGMPLKLPQLGQLVHCELSDVIVGFETNSNFAKTFPRLACLEISRMATKTALRTLLPSRNMTALSVKVLHMPSWRQSPLTPIVRMIAKSFPNIAELHIWLYNETKETLEEVFTYFHNIESLNITFAETGRTLHADSLLSGISEPDCNRIGELPDFGNVNLAELDRRPSLSNLTNLKKLVMKKVVICHMDPLTDFSAYSVLLKMSHLREVHLAGGIAQFHPKYEALLRDKLVLWIMGQ